MKFPLLNIKTVTDLREKTVQTLKEVSKSNVPFVVTRSSQPEAVLLGIKAFESLTEEIEDLKDTLQAMKLEQDQKQIRSARPLKDYLEKKGKSSD